MTVYDELYARHPALKPCADAIAAAHAHLVAAYRAGGKVLTCGNGGSAADSEHIVGELMKKFRRRRAVPAAAAPCPPPWPRNCRRISWRGSRAASRLSRSCR